MIYSFIYSLFFLFQEFFYRYNLQGIIEKSLPIIFYSIFLGCGFGFVNYLFPKFLRKWILGIILFILTIYYCAATLVYKTFGIVVSLSAASLLKNFTGDFLSTTFTVIAENLVTIAISLLIVVVGVLLAKFIDKKRMSFVKLMIQLVLCLLSFALFFGCLILNEESDEYNQYFKKKDYSASVNAFGVVPSVFIDLRKNLTDFEEEIEIIVEEEPVIEKDYSAHINESLKFDLEESNKVLNQMNTFFLNETVTYKNDFTGIFEGKNLIYIMAESFDGYFVNEELTPTLYKMIHSGLYFENYYSPTNMSTIGGEFSLLNGLIPDLTCLNRQWTNETGRYTNIYPYGLGSLFKDMGYSTFAYHNHNYDFQYRNNYLKAIGFDNYLGCWNGLEKRMACNIFPKSDDEMIKVTYEDYINEDHFMVYYATVSGHGDWAIGNNDISDKNIDVVKDMDYSTIVKRYIASNIELEYAMTSLLNALEENGRLNDTVIVLAADHHPYFMSESQMNELAGKTLDKFETYRNNLIIYNSEMEYTPISKVCNTIDVLPTTLNLFGIDYDSRIIIGKDILDSSSEGLVILSDYSFITDKGKYNSSNGVFNANCEIVDESEYVSKMKTRVYNRYLMSEYIMSNNYYNYIFTD